MTNYSLLLPINGVNNISFSTLSGLKVAKGYVRVVLGGRGPYIEFTKDQILFDNFYIPNHEKWRINSKKSFYIEYRSVDSEYVKLYHQKQYVGYADYKLKMFYITPFELTSDKYPCLIEYENLWELEDECNY